MSEVNRIVIVGGGTAGWLTAGLLAATHSGADNNGQRLSVTVIESDAVPPIGGGGRHLAYYAPHAGDHRYFRG